MGAEDWESSMVEYENPEYLKHSEFLVLVFAVEIFFPRFRGDLRWGHAVLRGWAVSEDV